jgi:hypothetical protein
MSQNIAFYLNPPSPTLETTKCHLLPPVSSLLLSTETETKLPKLCLGIPSPSLSSSSPLEPYSSTTSPSLSPYTNGLSLIDSLPSPQTSPASTFLSLTRCRSFSNASNNSINSILSDPPIFNPEVKRKRGRPPNSTSKTKQRDNWTFVTPTICDIKQQNIHFTDAQQQKDDEVDFTVLHWASNNSASIPKKKRGRKPKVQLAGNFCFVWRDLTARRGANKKKKSL